MQRSSRSHEQTAHQGLRPHPFAGPDPARSVVVMVRSAENPASMRERVGVCSRTCAEATSLKRRGGVSTITGGARGEWRWPTHHGATV